MIQQRLRPVIRDAAVVAGQALKPNGEGGASLGSPVGAWEWNVLTGQTSYSPRIYEILGLLPDRCPPELNGLLSEVHPDDRERVSEAVARAVEDRRGFELLYRTVGRDRRIRWIESRADVLPDEQGREVRFVGTMADVSARMEQAEAVRERERQLRGIIDVLPAAIYTTDAEGRITHFNEAAVELWGHRPKIGESEWCGSWRLYWSDGRPMRHDECPMAVALKEDRPIRGGEAIAERPDGTRVPFIPFPTPLHDTFGRLVGAVNMLVDISDRKAMEEERARHLQEAEMLNERLQRSMAETHHRVKNNLQIVSAIIDMMTAQAADAIPVSDVRTLSSHIRALAIVHDLLTRAAKGDGQAESVSVADILSTLIPLLERASGGHRIHAQMDDVRLPVRMATSLALVTNELVQNAVKYGRQEVQVAFCVAEGKATLRVSDDGPGFPPGFDPDKLETTGLDLVRNLSRWDLRGSVEFGNAEGGAVVTVELPLLAA